jgi:hypothetical protein
MTSTSDGALADRHERGNADDEKSIHEGHEEHEG